MKQTTKLHIDITSRALSYQYGISFLIERLNSEKGALYTSSYEYPNRYSCWDVGFINPPLEIYSKDSLVTFSALNDRGICLLEIIQQHLTDLESMRQISKSTNSLILEVIPSQENFPEEKRSQQPSVFSAIRHLIKIFALPDDPDLGLYGAFAYDLIFQFEHLNKQLERDDSLPDLHLYLPDEIYRVDHRKEEAICKRYDFMFQSISTVGIERTGMQFPFNAKTPDNDRQPGCDHQPGAYIDTIKQAKQKFACGDLFEVVPSQVFYQPTSAKPSELFCRLKASNPAPYGFLIHLGDEHLIGASPEMYVRVTGDRVETCPISGTIKRGRSPIEDSEQIIQLLQSEKESAELTMCTDVDRNDKSRICKPGSVKVIGRRQIEMYSRLIHTVDHVEGILQDGYDAVDAFLTHMWVVTVTGAPKKWAMEFIEQHEKTPRGWYAGAVGWFGFNNNLNTGLTLRTIRYRQGIAEVRVGATLLYDSDPVAEEAETRLKGSALMDVLQNKTPVQNIQSSNTQIVASPEAYQKRVLLIDHDDSFVHTLADYFRQAGAYVVTFRHNRLDWQYIDTLEPFDMVVLSPGPGSPKDFNLNATITEILHRNLAIFGVCLGLQAIVQYYGGQLEQLSTPVHGKSSMVTATDSSQLFKLLPTNFKVGRYHSLYAAKDNFPECLQFTAETEDGIIMAIEHNQLPIFAVQFHPETILSLEGSFGNKLIAAVMALI